MAAENSNKEKNRNSHGLGLSICNKIIKAMGGSIEVSSELGVVSDFKIRLVTEIQNEEQVPQENVSFCHLPTI